MIRKEQLLICDVDGVLADCRHRLHFQQAKDYDAFYSADNMAKDEMIVQGRDLFYNLIPSTTYSWRGFHYFKLFLTGRPERTRFITGLWLDAQPIATPDEVLFRKDGDYRPSDVVKVELLDEFMDKRYQTYADLTKRQLNKYNKLPLEEKRRLWMSELWTERDAFYIDDDPKNVKAVCQAYPEITGITFGIERLD